MTSIKDLKVVLYKLRLVSYDDAKKECGWTDYLNIAKSYLREFKPLTEFALNH